LEKEGTETLSKSRIGKEKNRITFGIRFLGSLGRVSHLQRLAVVAEKSGFDACWFAHDPFQPSSWVAATAVAAITRKIKIGYNVKPYTIDPSEIATFASALDEFSNGRLNLAIGSHTDTMYDWLGLGSTNLLDLTRESVELVRGLLAGETMEYSGRIFKWTKECYLRYSPLRKEVPIYIPGLGKDMFELSGRIGDGSLPMATPPESFDYPYRYIKQGAEEAGRDISDIDCAGLIWIYISKDGSFDKAALKQVIAYFIPYLELEMLARIGITRDDVEPIKKFLSQRDYKQATRAVSDKMLDLAVYGNTEDCIKRIERLTKKGATSISIGGPLGKNREEAIKIIGRDIIPYFQN
jgi:5,10-methylenetetrahydromethanopterin reductase